MNLNCWSDYIATIQGRVETPDACASTSELVKRRRGTRLKEERQREDRSRKRIEERGKGVTAPHAAQQGHRRFLRVPPGAGCPPGLSSTPSSSAITVLPRTPQHSSASSAHFRRLIIRPFLSSRSVVASLFSSLLISTSNAEDKLQQLAAIPSQCSPVDVLRINTSPSFLSTYHTAPAASPAEQAIRRPPTVPSLLARRPPQTLLAHLPLLYLKPSGAIASSRSSPIHC
ncbi:uncharacterized protein FOMMEDRAFT_158182 [Fomitiporia mediterranea MF3/22]|uniref:uncharacterized protein n=1 Tax=Fomitiporia mediterranea (strain MF3/22) TaxID=694068 RepID=UPI0004408897|nr:uncharacterized protein FOMMEDRAFT_158182 [Fomitiporia mediterranea MF3/22]EJD01049.1 hypothetical protein FOMMEDRAFT_158182 [Fomitiporia mediterranea MF3/22]